MCVCLMLMCGSIYVCTGMCVVLCCVVEYSVKCLGGYIQKCSVATIIDGGDLRLHLTNLFGTSAMVKKKEKSKIVVEYFAATVEQAVELRLS